MLHRVYMAALCLVAAACANHPAPLPAPAAQASPTSIAPPAETSADRRAGNAWTTNDAGLAIIRAAEGLKLEAYQLGGQWLIGYGHSKHVTSGMTISKEQAEAYLREDVGLCEGTVTTSVTVPVTRNEFSALVSLCYNIGPQTFSRSTLVASLNAGDRASAADSFLQWDKATVGGVKQSIAYLTKRRQQERALFLQP